MTDTTRTPETPARAPSRRDFLKLAGTAAPGLAAATLAGGATAEPAPVDPGSQRMQDTEHTRAYLASARF